MAAIRHIIQKEVFTPLDERMVGIVNVTKPGRKKKSSFLCIAGRRPSYRPGPRKKIIHFLRGPSDLAWTHSQGPSWHGYEGSTQVYLCYIALQGMIDVTSQKQATVISNGGCGHLTLHDITFLILIWQ